MGRPVYPKASRLLVTADGGSNSSRNRLWVHEFQRLTDEQGLAMSVCHFSPGTSKWNKFKHRMFCRITQNWRGRPLLIYRAIFQQTAATTTASSDNADPLDVKASHEDLGQFSTRSARPRGEWSDTANPRT